MNKKTFRLFHKTRYGTSASFGSLLFALVTFVISAIASIFMLPLIIIAFLIELPQAIGVGIENVSKFWGQLTEKAQDNQMEHLDNTAQTQAEYEEFQRIQFESEFDSGSQTRTDTFNNGKWHTTFSTDDSKVVIRHRKPILN
jgi:hypothetical protein